MHLLLFFAVTNSLLFILFASDAIVISTSLSFQTSMLASLLLFDTSLLFFFLAFDFIVVVFIMAEENAKSIKQNHLILPFSSFILGFN